MEKNKRWNKNEFYQNVPYFKESQSNKQGPFVQSIISLWKPVVEDLLSLTLLTIPIAVILFSEKLLGTFALQKLLTFFRPKMAVFLSMVHLKI